MHNEFTESKKDKEKQFETDTLDVVWEELDQHALILIISADNISKSPEVSSRIFSAWT